MIVTDLKYHLDDRFVEILDICAHRVSGRRRFQTVFITDGQEGYGKSTFTAAAAYYLGCKLNRPVTLFFDVDKLITFATKTEDQIIIWDDAAFAALTVEGYNRTIVKLIKLLLLARKKRHTYFINIQEVFRLKEMLVARAIGLMHVYSRDQIEIGRFTYYRGKNLKYLYDTWTRKKKKIYDKAQSFHGTFPNVMTKIFNEAEYDILKDHAILSIGEDKEDPKERDLRRLRLKLGTGWQVLGHKQEEYAEKMGIPSRTLSYWAKNQGESPTIDVDVVVSEAATSKMIINRGYIQAHPNMLSKPQETREIATNPPLIAT